MQPCAVYCNGFADNKDVGTLSFFLFVCFVQFVCEALSSFVTAVASNTLQFC